MLNLKRFLIALPIVAIAIAATVYFLVPRETDRTIRTAALVETPDAAGRKVGVQPGQLAPNFEASTNDGRRIRLSDYRGRAVLINFWAQWCTSCLSEMPDIKRVQEQHGDALAVIAVNAGETKAEAQEFIDFLSAPSFTFAMDPGLKLSDAYGVLGLPNSVFIDAEGVVQAVYAGHADTTRLNAYVQAAMAKQAPAPQPLQFRPVSRIPRDYTLVVERKDDLLTLSAPSLRCVPTYCADPLIDVLRQVAPDLTEASFEPARGSERVLKLRYKPSDTSVEALVAAVIAELNRLQDPLYSGSPKVVYR